MMVKEGMNKTKKIPNFCEEFVVMLKNVGAFVRLCICGV
jgi:hypothetical protein